VICCFDMDEIILYHGTSTQFLPNILEEGLLPRKKTKVASHWEGDVESKPDLVYLTTAYPVFFAIQAVNEPHKPVVLQVSVPINKLYPDEDFLAKMLSIQEDHALPLRQYNPLVNPKKNKHLAQDCLRYNGIVAVDKVLPKQIKAHVVLDLDWRLMHIGGDSMPIPMNYKILGKFYGNCTAALFSGGIDVAMDIVMQRRAIFDKIMELSKHPDENKERLAELWKSYS
jgi:hypothetical protein